MPTIDELRKIRKDKLIALRKKGIDPYPALVSRKETISQARDMKGKTVSLVVPSGGLFHFFRNKSVLIF